MSTIYKIPILLEKCGKTHLMFDINKISLMYLVVVVIYFLAVPGGPGKPGQPSRCPGKDAQIYLSIHQETSNYLSTLPSPLCTPAPGSYNWLLVQRIAQFKQMGGDKMDR